ncbi:hypothetical protein [Legionella maioricensis]|uniref:Uncharacterized protein n=1 Tax=Legionella maioricensis TaxID=2896528 RepID=A0A9X2D446_9GAMM|nr:hypothetical protein [Legionella maioricensis]MCL9685695.1 hypothetical protein [Legionella maioricensis]MCL9689083.1 hypothetical protein [Legionella maioricensis]
MRIQLTDIFAKDKNGKFLKDNDGVFLLNPKKLPGAKRPISSFQDLLDTLDRVTSISDDPDVTTATKKTYVKELTKLLLRELQEHLKKTKADWHDDKFNPKIYIVAKQLEALAYLTGEVEYIRKYILPIGKEPDDKEVMLFPNLEPIKCDYQKYEETNFLDNDSELAFSNFERELLTVQMILRVLNPRFINQRHEQVCGVNAFVHNIAIFNPLQYVEMVGSLAETGEVDIQKLSFKRGSLKVKVTKSITDKQPAGEDLEEIRDVDHVILNGIRASENALMSYDQESSEVGKQLFGVTTSKELKSWMKQSSFHNVQNIPIHDRDSIKQLGQLIQDGYMVGFLGTATLANIIITPEDDLPAEQNKISQAMDGHFFVINNIEYDEQNDNVKIRILTWGEQSEATIPFKVWEAHKGVIGGATVGQTPYAAFLMRAKVKQMSTESTFCSPEVYCMYVKNIISGNSEYKEIQHMIDDAYKHTNGQTWMESAQKIQDYIEGLPKEKRPKDVPHPISLIPSVTPEVIDEFNRIHKMENRGEKIEALKKMGVKDNIEVQRQLVALYAQEGRWPKIKELFTSVPSYREINRTIMKESLQMGCNRAETTGVSVPQDIISLIKENTLLKAEDLVNYLSDITGLPKGGAFTYGIKGRLLEVVNIRRMEEGKDKVDTLQNFKLDKKDVVNFVSLLDREIHKSNPAHLGMNNPKLNEFCDSLIDHFEKGIVQPISELHGAHKKSFFQKMGEFFLKIASIISDNVISKNINSTIDYKSQFANMKESSEEVIVNNDLAANRY